MFTRQTGDKIAIPFFAFSTFYFLNRKKKTKEEVILLLFSISGLIMDTYWTLKDSYKLNQI